LLKSNLPFHPSSPSKNKKGGNALDGKGISPVSIEFIAASVSSVSGLFYLSMLTLPRFADVVKRISRTINP
jgi:hypothetical protein